jgi:ATP-dependent Clp protease ATP-binding subunit ClpC
MQNVMGRLKSLGFDLELTEKAKNFLGEKGYDQQFGARPLHRAIQKYLEDPLAEEILSLQVKEGDTLIADLDEEKSLLKFSHKVASKKEKTN